MSNIRVKQMQGGDAEFARSRLRAQLSCEWFFPDTPGYDARRALWNDMIDRRPAAIAAARTEEEAAAVVAFAAANGLLLTIRAGGHNIAGLALRDGALALDVQDMKAVSVDPEARIARVGPGAVLADVDAATQAHGLIVPTGINSTTGIAGLTLGGGFGWASRKYGLTIDSLRSARVVLADGSIAVASARRNADLFWALRGGGGNFGVVTEFEFALHPAGPEVVAGILIHPLDDAETVLPGVQQAIAEASDDLTVWSVLRKAPPLPFLAEEWHGRDVVILPWCHLGSGADAESAAACLRSIGTPVAEHSGPMAFVAWQQVFDPLLTPGARNYWKSHDVASFNREGFGVIADAARTLPSDECEIFLGHIGGAAARVDTAATAWHNRDAHFVVNVHTRWRDPADDERCVGWTRALFDALKPHATGSRYVNFVPEEDAQHQLGDVFGGNLERLRAVKRKVDPENLFRSNLSLEL